MLNVTHIVQSGGLLLIAALIFGESGMFIGFFFPGDTLLLTAGIFAAQGKLSLPLAIIVISLAAIAGDNVGYQIGDRYGRKLFDKPNGLLFRREHIEQTEEFYKKYGSKTMLIAHFVPVVRAFAPAIAGIGEMPYKQFIMFDAIGDIAWAAIVTLIGYYFGRKIPNIDHYILLAVLAVIILTLGPALYHLAKVLLKRRELDKKKSSKSNK
jgi:membrane-associated protein